MRLTDVSTRSVRRLISRMLTPSACHAAICASRRFLNAVIFGSSKCSGRWYHPPVLPHICRARLFSTSASSFQRSNPVMLVSDMLISPPPSFRPFYPRSGAISNRSAPASRHGQPHATCVRQTLHPHNPGLPDFGLWMELCVPISGDGKTRGPGSKRKKSRHAQTFYALFLVAIARQKN